MIRGSDSRGRLRSRSPINSGGSILIIALWAISLLSVFAVILGTQARYKMTLVKRLEERAGLRLASEAGIRFATAKLATEAENGYHSMIDLWSNDPQSFKNVNCGEAAFDICYQYVYDISKGPELRYGLVDEERKININKSDRTVLKHLLVLVLNMDEDMAQGLAASIVDWRDGDEELSVPVGSAESLYYRGLSTPYESKNADFDTLEELLLVRDVNRDMLERIRGFVTVYGSGKINVNTAPKQVLMAVGLNERIADDIMSFRMGKDRMVGTVDDGIFDATSNIVPSLSQFASLSPSDISMLNAVVDQHLAVISTAFSIRSVGRSKDGKTTYVAAAVVNKKGKVLSWQES
ncbi:MAG: hypothetical protein WC515_08405 [Candidatus Omnitrophota bacterium]